jgi:fatty-acyl-CoA synthase
VLPAWVAGLRMGFGAPERFLRKPRTWLDDAASMNATIAVAPNFAIALATRIAERTPPKNAMPMRRIILGGERIEWSTLMKAHDVLGPYGWTLDTFMPAYGLAENTLSVTAKLVDETPKHIEVNQAAAYLGELDIVSAGSTDAETRSIVSCGPPVRHTSVRTTNDTGVGQICVRSTSLSDGYLNQPEKTSQRFVDGELITEDIGFIRDGELYVIGRVDDVIPLGGRNVHARDVELVIEANDEVRDGCTALVNAGDSDTPRLLFVAETAKGAEPEFGALATTIADAAYRAADVKVEEVVFVRGGSLPKTPSGKIQRSVLRKERLAELEAT